MANFGNKLKLTLNKSVSKPGKKEKERVLVGVVSIPCPILADFGITATQANYDKTDPASGAVAGQPAFEDGIPVYSDARADWLQQAIVGKVSAMSRNRFKPGTIELKPGMQLAEDFDALTAETQRTGEALALRREAATSFEAYLQAQNKKAGTVQTLRDLFYNSAKVLPSASEVYIQALTAHVSKWIPSLTEAQQARFAPKIAELQESINSATKADDLESDLMPA